MQYNWVEIVGTLAGFCTVTSFLPQVIKVWRTKSVKDISLGMYAALIVGTSLWCTYGVITNSISMIMTNVFTLTLILSIFFMKIKYDGKGR